MSAVAALRRRPPAGLVRTSILVGLLTASLAACGLITLALGVPRVPLGELRTILLEGGGERVPRLVVLELRLPRLILGALAGAMLAVAGLILQDAFRNELAGPELFGVSAGASLVVATLVIFRVGAPWALVPWLALAGGTVAGATVLAATRRARGVVHVILVGAALSALLNALVVAVISLGTQSDIASLYLFLVGSLAGRTWRHLAVVLPWAALGLPLALACARVLNVLRLGDDVASGLGLPVRRVRGMLILLSAALVAAVVAVCGPISWIALLAPHLARRAMDTVDARRALPIAALGGAVLLVWADALARLAFTPVELPVGLWTTLLGSPMLLVLLHRRSGRRL